MFIIPNADIQYVYELLYDKKKRLQIWPYAALKCIPQEHISLFCMREGLYCLPTMELIDFMRSELVGRAIEIGAGNGVIAQALGIKATDSRMQERPEIRHHYEAHGQAVVTYGHNVEKIDGNDAVARFKPDTVVAAWVTHKYNPKEHWREGNQYGVDEGAILRQVRKYVFVGNEGTHIKKPILSSPHRTIKAEWLLSRSLNRHQNVIWVWEG